MRRLAVVGGGIGGVATAYLCDADWTIDLFEAEPRLGGNAATVEVEGTPVDLGAETFNPATHPLYWRLLAQIGADETIVEIPGTLSVFDASTRRSRFVSSHALRTPRYAVGFAQFTRAARRFIDGDPSPDLTVGEWFDHLSADRPFEREVLLPWLASLTSSRVETLKAQSMLAFLTLFAPAFPANVLASAKTYGSRIGLGGIVDLLAERCENLTVQLGSPVSRVSRDGDGWYVETPAGRHGPYERVVVNAPPYAARELLVDAPTALRELLARYDYYPARLVLHRDASCTPADRHDWAMHNAAADHETCEATFWLGAYRTDAAGLPLDLFKSWATYRDVAPATIVAEREFRHLLLTPDAVRAAADLERWQGVDGLHFVGHATAVTDLQETALESGMNVAQALSPESPRLRALT